MRGALELLCICVVYIAPALGVVLILLIIEIWLLSIVLNLVVKLIGILRAEQAKRKDRALEETRSFKSGRKRISVMG